MQTSENRPQMLDRLQRTLHDKKISTIIVFEGLETAGIGKQINRLIQALDPRGYRVYDMSTPSSEEKQHPPLWRFWNRIPPKGQIAFFDHSWYHRAFFNMDPAHPKYAEEIEHISDFESTLSADGYIIIKIFLDISYKEQKKRIMKLRKNPALSWKVGNRHTKQLQKHERYMLSIRQVITHTDHPYAPWTIVDTHRQKKATMVIMDVIIDTLQKALEGSLPTPSPVLPDALPKMQIDNFEPDLSLSLSKPDYREALKAMRKKMSAMQNTLYRKKISMVVLYEGWDAAGKGGNIKRLTRSLDPRGYQVIPIGAPNDEEHQHHYLWRFWRRLPKDGHIAIFDRSWYGRLLVERVEGFADEVAWKRSFHEIRQFEEALIKHGVILVKFWLSIDQDTQLRRFEARQQDPDKQWKITPEDWRNRAKWGAYKVALDDVFRYTNTPRAPWHILESNCKRYARIKAMEVIEAAYRSRMSNPPNMTKARTLMGG